MDISTATPESLVAKLLDGALRHARHAHALQGPARLAERCRSLSKAVAIVGELRSALDLEQGGEIAANLDALYAFVIDRFLEANLHGSADPIDDALRTLGPIAEAWTEIVRRGEGAARQAS
jgi:flagellar protein FliS